MHMSEHLSAELNSIKRKKRITQKKKVCCKIFVLVIAVGVAALTSSGYNHEEALHARDDANDCDSIKERKLISAAHVRSMAKLQWG